jgi:hypothetical protein
MGDVIAEREVKLRRKGHRASVIQVRFGRPTKEPDSDALGPWSCPILITGLGKPRMESVTGIDSLQALTLALEYVVRMLPFEAKRAGATLDWLGETERPVFGGTYPLELYSRAINVLFNEIESALKDLKESGNCEKAKDRVAKRLERAWEKTGFRRSATPRRTTG